jgi:hypothetical protein
MSPVTSNYHFEDFTEDGYGACLDLAAAHWRFTSFDVTMNGPHILWRHDIDVSPNRALRLAQIEHARGLKATYFFLLHSGFYNCLESDVRTVMRQIVSYGHDIGVHFDVAFYPEIEDLAELERRIELEAEIIGDLAKQAPSAVSFHNPTAQQLDQYDQSRLGGLANAYGRSLRENYRYVSDSNGYWRFHRLQDVLTERANPALHVLTHPEWWVPECRSPRDRIVRAIEGRAVRSLETYDAFLKAQGRENVR